MKQTVQDYQARLAQQAQQQRKAQQQAELARQREARHKQAEPIVNEFTALCRKRSLGMAGYRDSSSDWKDTPQPLREQVDSYNAMPEAAQRRVLADMKDDPAKVKGIADLLQQRTLVRNRDHGFGL
ncbi:hypothetical protein [Halomonas colorata]|uniref:Uncharacterized protein n=1 Tax=Halomonas colorata TaxID=2742615 RepID=A0ABR9G3U2_9GAMM|nr:hypothetical protein [Halomonas colorata]MBE0465573.1 hypothetical protein [Halomonas colorata]